MQPSTSYEDAQIDTLPATDAMACMIASHIAAVEAVRGATLEIARAAELVAETLQAGGCVHYAAAGSSGLMAVADACELPGTFRIPHSQIRICMAGGVPADGRMPGDTEDHGDEAIRAARAVEAGDVALIVSASGTTPYTLAFADEAARRGAHVVGIANVPGSALMARSNTAIVLDTAPEVVEGSTRLGAGTAQKVALNMISTQAGILMGHVHDGLMVNLHPENIKLRRRAADIVARIAGVPAADADKALARTGYDTKLATLAAFGINVDDAKVLLSRHGGHLRACLADNVSRTTTEK